MSIQIIIYIPKHVLMDIVHSKFRITKE